MKTPATGKKEKKFWQGIYTHKCYFCLVKLHVSHGFTAYQIVVFIPIRTAEAKYEYNVMIPSFKWSLS